MSPSQIENGFLKCLAKSDFVYLVDIGGYIGDVVSMELGFAIARNIPIYAQEPINLNLDIDPYWREKMREIKVMNIEEAVRDYLDPHRLEEEQKQRLVLLKNLLKDITEEGASFQNQ